MQLNSKLEIENYINSRNGVFESFFVNTISSEKCRCGFNATGHGGSEIESDKNLLEITLEMIEQLKKYTHELDKKIHEHDSK